MKVTSEFFLVLPGLEPIVIRVDFIIYLLRHTGFGEKCEVSEEEKKVLNSMAKTCRYFNMFTEFSERINIRNE